MMGKSLYFNFFVRYMLFQSSIFSWICHFSNYSFLNCPFLLTNYPSRKLLITLIIKSSYFFKSLIYTHFKNKYCSKKFAIKISSLPHLHTRSNLARTSYFIVITVDKIYCSKSIKFPPPIDDVIFVSRYNNLPGEYLELKYVTTLSPDNEFIITLQSKVQDQEIFWWDIYLVFLFSF